MRIRFRLKCSFALVLMGLAFTLLLHVQVASGQQITKRVGIVSLYPYQPKAITKLDQLPMAINKKLTDHLIDRLGEEFFSKLKFSYGSGVNFDDLYKINPGARDYKWKVFAFNVSFVFTDPSVGIKLYEAEIWLDKEGDVVREIDLPKIRNHPEKAKIISVKEAKKISKLNKFSPERIELLFREKEDSIAWRMVRYTDDGTTWCLDISAHSGEILEKFGMKGIHLVN